MSKLTKPCFKLKSITDKIMWKNLNGKFFINFNTNSMKDAIKLKKCLSISYFSKNINGGYKIVSIETKFDKNISTGAYIN